MPWSTDENGNPVWVEGEESSEPVTIQERAKAGTNVDDRLAWVDIVAREVLTSMLLWGESNGYSSDIMSQQYSAYAVNLFDAIESQLFANANAVASQGKVGRSGFSMEPGGEAAHGQAWYLDTMDGMNAMIDWAVNWMGGQTGIPLQRKAMKGPSGGGRGSGRRGISRNDFDLDQLTRAVNEINRSLVLEDHSNPSRIAREYVDAMIATGGTKQIDFETFVEKQIESTARYKSLYRNKPEHVNARQHMAPYLQSAMQFAAPDEAADIAIGGAQFGATAEQFRQRLQRTDAVTGSAPFINQMEGRLRDLNSLFKE